MTETETVPWPRVVARARHLLEERGDVVSDLILANLGDVVDFAQVKVAPPDVGIGYWPTVSLCWQFLALEIFEYRIEVYPPTPPGKPLNVWDEQHVPGNGFSDAFKAALLNADVSPDAIR